MNEKYIKDLKKRVLATNNPQIKDYCMRKIEIEEENRYIKNTLKQILIAFCLGILIIIFL